MNVCGVLIYLMEASVEATRSLYNGKLFHTYIIEKKASGVLGVEGI